MMGKIFLVAALLFIPISFSSHDVAASPNKAHDEEKEHEQMIRHYEVPPPASREEAVKILQEKIEDSRGAVARDDMPRVHENSYSIEAAIDVLREKTEDAALKNHLDELGEINQEVHEASEAEEVDLDRVKKRFGKLVSIWQDISGKI